MGRIKLSPTTLKQQGFEDSPCSISRIILQAATTGLVAVVKRPAAKIDLCGAQLSDATYRP
jgi:hypothetical protein